MEKIKSILQNKKIQATILILLICILFIAVLISNRSGKKKSLWNYKEASDSNAQETTIITEEIIKEIDAEVETDTNGKIFSILVEEETIDLSSDEIETESASDGSVTYKVGDNTQVVVNKDGEAKVIKKETVTKVVTVNTNKNNQTGNNQAGNNQTGNNQTGNGILSGNIPSTSPVQPPSNPSSLDGNPSGPQEQESSSWDNTATDPSEESTTKPSEEESSEDTERTNPDAISQ
ncbi:MAG: hypothetical protein HFH63_02705 [Lachnospiraceae bacterium]|nr:hypothetical protein [Lachnospiraceae bacterium]